MWLSSFLALTIDGRECSLSRPGRFNPGKIATYLFSKSLSWSPYQYGCVKKYFVPAGIRTTDHPACSLITVTTGSDSTRLWMSGKSLRHIKIFNVISNYMIFKYITNCSICAARSISFFCTSPITPTTTWVETRFYISVFRRGLIPGFVSMATKCNVF